MQMRLGLTPLQKTIPVLTKKHAQFQPSLSPGEIIQLSQQPKQFMKQLQPLMMAKF